jgi:hypothetical protein
MAFSILTGLNAHFQTLPPLKTPHTQTAAQMMSLVFNFWKHPYKAFYLLPSPAPHFDLPKGICCFSSISDPLHWNNQTESWSPTVSTTFFLGPHQTSVNSAQEVFQVCFLFCLPTTSFLIRSE